MEGVKTFNFQTPTNGTYKFENNNKSKLFNNLIQTIHDYKNIINNYIVSLSYSDVIISYSDEIISNLNRLSDIGKLSYDWNGYHAKPFKTTLIDKCKKIVLSLSHQPEIFPTGRQSIQFEYELEDGSYLEFEIFENNTSYLFIPQYDYDNAIEKELNDEFYEIPEKVDEFYE